MDWLSVRGGVVPAVALAVMVALTTVILVAAFRDTGCRPARGTFAEGTRESSWLRFSCGVDADRPDGVVVHLHGDGAGEIDNPDGDLSELAEVATSRNMVLLAPRTPDSA